VPSTVLDLTLSPARIVRRGPVTAEMLAEVLELAPAPID
jgi:tRNA A37 threonylcarbamoyladenosine synthetase subunit TsaC/SUA5/YrdC